MLLSTQLVRLSFLSLSMRALCGYFKRALRGSLCCCECVIRGDEIEYTFIYSICIYYELPTDGDDTLLDVRAVDTRLSPNETSTLFPTSYLICVQGLHFMAPGLRQRLRPHRAAKLGRRRASRNMRYTIIQYRENAIKFVIPLSRWDFNTTDWKM